MAYRHRRVEPPARGRLGLLILGSTGVLTLSFFGLLAILTGETAGIAGRLPIYALGMAVAFVATILVSDRAGRDPWLVLIGASTVAIVVLVGLTLAGEGLVYAVRNPDRALATQQVLYLIAAGLIGTGVGYWGLAHWREVAGSVR